MRFSKLFARTLREPPSDAESISHQLLVRGGYIRQLASGVFSFLPLGWRVIRKIEAILREEMDAIGGQEILMPVVQPAELWQESRRWYDVGPELVRWMDRAGHDMVLAMTHEEVVADLARKEIVSYRQLPQVVYQIQTKFRDEPRPRGGLIRVREFHMKDAYSLHTSFEDLDRYYPIISDAYVKIFKRAGLDVARIEADSGMMGGTSSHEFVVIADSGENTIVRCENGDYAANLETAYCASPQNLASPLNVSEPSLPLEEVPTPHTTTIDGLAHLLNISTAQTLKSMLYSVNDEVAMVVLRGDRTVNEFKLPKVLGTDKFRLATADEIRAAGAVEGYASPLGLRQVKVFADQSVRWGTRFVVGANKDGFHTRNAEVLRDLGIAQVYDLGNVQDGDRCAQCGGRLTFQHGIEVGHIFKLGTRYSDKLHATYLDQNGASKPIVMGCYGIGSGRLAAAAVEQHHDDKGICWPPPIAPYHIHLIGLGLADPQLRQTAETLYQELLRARLEVLYDDREDAQAGVKFNDADLIGIPIRATLSPRSLKAGGVEIKLRHEPQSRIVPLPDLTAALGALVGQMIVR
ncbi:MAG: proline--tRNA ligase [Chloroflexi bacterium]|nr:proline--tRNA ligase [Chloroflexota bacterium]